MSRFENFKVTKKIKFLGQDIEINKLDVAGVLEIQELARAIDKENPSDKDNLKILLRFVRLGVEEFAELSDDELFKFPMEDLSNLSTEISKYSGLGK